MGTRGLVLHPDFPDDRRGRDPARALEEAVALAAALPALEVIGADVIGLRKILPGTLFGTGKIQEIADRVKADDIGLVLIDGHVSPVQQRNLEDALGTKVLDRTGLILEIFADRAQTREGVLQVELAALSYQRTRLVRAWTHLERQRGGLGFVGGPGETQIEADRRAIDEAVGRIKRQLSKVVKTRALHRAARAKVPFPIVALVGYTNAGKSTLFNRLTGAEVLAKDMLFATLDPTMRSVELPGGLKVILSDTVGFISDLPTQLVAAFRATLEEVLEADVILHVRDVAHPESGPQATEVARILTELGVKEDTPQLEVLNKVDLLPPDEAEALRVRATREPELVTISALAGKGMEALSEAVGLALQDPQVEVGFDLPFQAGAARAWLHARDLIVAEDTGETGWQTTVKWTDRQARQFYAEFGVGPVPPPLHDDDDD